MTSPPIDPNARIRLAGRNLNRAAKKAAAAFTALAAVMPEGEDEPAHRDRM